MIAGGALGLAAGLALYAAGVRLFWLDAAGLWADEVFSYLLALGRARLFHLPLEIADHALVIDHELFRPTDDVGRMLDELRRRSPYGPAYYLILHATLRLVPLDEPTMLRLWNVVFSAATAPVLFLFLRRALSPTAAFGAVFLWASSPWDVSVGLQLKAYPLATLGIVLSTALLCRLVEERSPAPVRVAIAYGLAAAVAILSHPFALLALPLHGVWVVLRSGAERRTAPLAFFGLGTAVTAALAAPWILFAASAQTGAYRRSLALNPTTAYEGFVPALGLLFDAFSSNALPLVPEPALGAAAGIVLAVLLLGASGRAARDLRARRLARLAGWMALGPFAVALVYAASVETREVLWPRYFVLFLPFAAVAFVLGLEGLAARGTRLLGRPRFARVALGLALATCVTVQTIAFTASGLLDREPDGRELARRLAARISPQARIVHVSGGFETLLFLAAWRGGNPVAAWIDEHESGLARAAAARPEQPLWIVLDRGRRGDLERVTAFLEDRGRRRVGGFSLPSGDAVAFAPSDS